jgi:TRAP-type mannitol/chloroaromatic compound transport system permease small subunit
MKILMAVDRLLATSIAFSQWLVLPLIVLLFLQWPLRDLVGCCSREANDLGQIVFAIFVAVSVAAATRAGTHLAADALAQRYSPSARHLLRKIGALVGLVPWALFVLISSRPTVVTSVAQGEHFAETGNPGYFLIKVAIWVLALTVLAQAVLDLARPAAQDDV